MGKIKIVGDNNLNENVNGESFNNITSETIFSFGNFTVTSNFEGIPTITNNKLSSFVKPITFSDLNISESGSNKLSRNLNECVVNRDNSDFNAFVRYGSAYDFIRTTIKEIIDKFPSSLFVSNNFELPNGNITLFDYSYDAINNISSFKIPSQYIVNNFKIIFDEGNMSFINDNQNKIKNLNVSYSDYVIYRTDKNKTYSIIDFRGDSLSTPYITITCEGDSFSDVVSNLGNTFTTFHIKPKPVLFEDYRNNLSGYGSYIMSSRRNVVDGFEFTLKDPVLLDDGNIEYSERKLLWPTTDGYNIDIDGAMYNRFLDIVTTISGKLDNIKTDLLLRFLTPKSLKTYDLTEDGKYSKLIRLYGQEFDKVRGFVDQLAYINRVDYNKKNTVPDALMGNLARVMGWDYVSLLNEKELVESIFSIDNNVERNTKTDLLPYEIDIELWRRIIINTNYFLKTKGCRDAIKSILLMIGVPEPFIDITEYVYTVEGIIDVRTTTLNIEPENFGSGVYPFDDNGFPKTPPNTRNFYFQLNGDSDGGDAYMDNFRKAGFNLYRTVDNKKSWVEGGSLLRRHKTTPQYRQDDSKLVLNTKVVDIALDASRGIEYDTFKYIKDIDFPINSSGFTLENIYINVGLNYSGDSVSELALPPGYDNDTDGHIEVRVNGILLNHNKFYDGANVVDDNNDVDYYIEDNKIKFSSGSVSQSLNDTVQVSYVSNSLNPISNSTIDYVVCKVNTTPDGAKIMLPEAPSGKVQLTINGVALIENITGVIGNGDFTINTTTNEIVITNLAVINYIIDSSTKYVQIAYTKITGSNELIEMRTEWVKYVGSTLSSAKLYRDTIFGRYVFRLFYRVSKTTDIKVMVDGIMLHPNVDYVIDNNNKRNLLITVPNIPINSIVSVYYLVADEEYFEPIISNSFGLGDITQLSFLEFIDLLLTKTINARNRQTITDHKGGWYPSITNMYVLYLKRSLLLETDPLKSNGYTFNMLYNFLGRYNSIFGKFVTQLLPATIIQKSSGLVIRNTVFSRQKFAYKRGVSFDTDVKYLGDDGVLNLKKQDVVIPYFNLTVNVDGEGAVYPPEGVHIYGDEAVIDLVAVPSTGWSFVDWNINGEVVLSPFKTVVMVEDITATATFVLVDYVIELFASPPNGGTVIGGGSYNLNDSVSVIATPQQGYEFVNWTEGGVVVSTSTEYTFNVVGNRVLTANFTAITYNINVSESPSGTATVSGGGEYSFGANCVVVVGDIQEGYEFVNWTEDGDEVSTQQSYSFNVDSDRTLVANLSLIQYNINASAEPVEGGTVGGDGEYDFGTNVVLIATPEIGYGFVNWTEGGVVVSSDSTYSFPVSGDRTLVANFQLQGMLLSISETGNGDGNINVNGSWYTTPITFPYGTELTINGLPAINSNFGGWSGDIVSSDQTIIFNIVDDTTLVGNFILKTFNLVYSTDGNGVILGDANQTVNYGGDGVMVESQPDTGYTFSSWSDGVLTAQRTDTNITSNLSVIGQHTINNYTVTFNDWDGTVLKVESVNHGSDATAPSPSPTRTGYTFNGWSGVFINVTSNLTITALYIINEYVLTVNVVGDGLVRVDGSDYTTPLTFDYNTSVNLLALSGSGYTFSGWSGDLISFDNSESIVMDNNKTITATFVEDTPPSSGEFNSDFNSDFNI